ncbi:MAG: UbiA prenyltransferase family protein, partial [Candidatus Thermoplasmatota archaeon]|nr:UbiA prenyltransferase family protein [Candidatus Thermoplasmatota archaeon]
MEPKQYSYKPTFSFIIAMKESLTRQSATVLKFFTGFIRIRGVCTWLVISFIGFLLGITSLEITRYLLSLGFFIISTFFILSFTFSINNYYDVDTDKENPRRAALNVLASGTISKHTGMILNLLFIIVPLVLSLFITWKAFVFCAFLLLFMWMYSAPPLRLKGRPGLDIIWHFIALFALVLWGAFLAGFISRISILVAISFGVYGCFAQLDNHIHDYPFDKASGSITFAVRMGLPTTYKALIATFLLYIVSLLPLLIL